MTSNGDASEGADVVSVQTSTGPAIKGSREAIRRMTVLLEVLSGLRGPTEGAQALGINQTRYYQLETMGLQGIVAAMEPRPRGRRPRPAEERIASLEAELSVLRQDLCSAHALLRQAQRAIGLSEPASTRASPKGRKKAKTKRRGKARGAKVLAKLKAEVSPD